MHISGDFLSFSTVLFGSVLELTPFLIPIFVKSHVKQVSFLGIIPSYLSAGLTKGICIDQESELSVIILHVFSQRWKKIYINIIIFT